MLLLILLVKVNVIHLLRLYLTSQRIILRSEVTIGCTLTSFLLIFFVCTFYDKEGCYIRRCKDKLKSTKEKDQDYATDEKDVAVFPQNLSSPSHNCSTITCSCRKFFSGHKGVKCTNAAAVS